MHLSQVGEGKREGNEGDVMRGATDGGTCKRVGV